MGGTEANRTDGRVVRPRWRAKTGLPCLFSVLGVGLVLSVLYLSAFTFLRPRPQTYAIALGDLDGDGDLDAFYANGESEAPHPNMVLINLGGSQDGRPAQFQVSGERLGNFLSRSVELADLDGDGDLDAWVTHEAFVTIFYNNGQGRFAANSQTFPERDPIYGSGQWVFALGDLDSDGDPDALAGGCCGTMVIFKDPPGEYFKPFNLIWVNQGGVQYGTPGDFIDSGERLESLGAQGVALGDLDSDGYLDAFFGNHFIMRQPDGELSDSQPNTVWWNDGQGRMVDSGQRLGSAQTKNVALGDLDGDGDLDGYSANYGPDEVWLNAGGKQGGQPGAFQDSRQRLGDALSTRIFLADMDGDGDLDAAVTTEGWRTTLEIRFNDGQGNFSGVRQRLGPFKAQAFALGDLDGDSDLDVLAGWFEHGYTIWWNRGEGRFGR